MHEQDALLVDGGAPVPPPVPQKTLLVDSLGNLILDATGNAIEV